MTFTDFLFSFGLAAIIIGGIVLALALCECHAHEKDREKGEKDILP